ncbi:MAG: hypothetical protein H8D56_03010 [Planctomycetes bacterium]|nr:hypothetical protein [Planctomycetota bacterium]MBL7144922.1 hypothetical protein [Phycisphaerae bacterium]
MACEEKYKVPENHRKTSFKESKEAPAQGKCRKVKKPILTLMLCAFVFLTGCATITTGKYQNVLVTSEPPGIQVRSCTGVSLITPGSFELVRNEDYTLFAEYSDCEPQQKELKHKLQGSFWTNTLIWGATSGAVDLASGASDELVPKKVHFDFTSAGQAVASRQHSYLESNPDTTEEVRFAILNDLAKKGMTKEELMASLGKPDLIDQEGEAEVFVYNNPEVQRYYLENGILKGTVAPKKNQQKWSRLTP